MRTQYITWAGLAALEASEDNPNPGTTCHTRRDNLSTWPR